MCHICAILNGIAGIVVFSAPSAVSAAWFPPSERTTATGVAIVFNNLGNAVSFVLGPGIVPDPPDSNKTQHVGLWMAENYEEVYEYSIGNTTDCPKISNSTKEMVAERIEKLMLTGKSILKVPYVGSICHW